MSSFAYRYKKQLIVLCCGTVELTNCKKTHI